MQADPGCGSETNSEKARRYEARWLKLCAAHLPISSEDSIWRYNRASRAEDPVQGWKLHVSATVLNAHLVLGRVASVLAGSGIRYKAPITLQTLHRLNAGFQDTYSQVGKVITVYPPTEQYAVLLARQLHEVTRNFLAPAVPFDFQYKSKSNVYYRYGAFRALKLENPGGSCEYAIKDGLGNLVQDVYRSELGTPGWVEDPFRQSGNLATAESEKGMKPSFRVFRALSQRGKGGVYQAVDLRGPVPRLCLLKEGRKAGELGWDGRDGRWRTKREKKALVTLQRRGVRVPRVYTSFESCGHYYLVTEFIDGENLHSFLLKRHRRISIPRALRLAIELSTFVAQVHAAGWVWRDCKPANLILTKDGELRSLDFEGAYRIGQSAPTRWITPAFAQRKPNRSMEPGLRDDLHALGTVIYLLVSGRLPEAGGPPAPLSKLRRNVPEGLQALVSGLIDEANDTPLDAQMVTATLSALFERLTRNNDLSTAEA